MLARLPSPSQSILSASFFDYFVFQRSWKRRNLLESNFSTRLQTIEAERKKQTTKNCERRTKIGNETQRLEHRPLGFVIAQKHPFEVHERGGAGTGLAKRAQCIGNTKAEGEQWGQMKKDEKSQLADRNAKVVKCCKNPDIYH